jgi:hypothetical protein
MSSVKTFRAKKRCSKTEFCCILSSDMPLTAKGSKIMSAMKRQYGAKKGESVFYASRNKGTIKGVDPESKPKRRGLKHIQLRGK